MPYDDQYPEYVPVAERKRKTQQAAEKIKKKKPDLAPVIIEGRKLAKTWWGKAWNDNLERYSDYSNRIGRGRSYVRNGAVLDLKIEQGKIKALVQGSARKPYTVDINISPLEPKVWTKIRTACEGKIESMRELIEGKFPASLADLFTTKGTGLFPAPREITFHCSCPDWAVMCKHVAAVLYGIGARLDEDPAMFFTLRDVNMDDLISQAVQGKAQTMLSKSGTKSRRILEDADIAGIFGVQVEVVQDEMDKSTTIVKKRSKRKK